MHMDMDMQASETNLHQYYTAMNVRSLLQMSSLQNKKLLSILMEVLSKPNPTQVQLTTPTNFN